MTKDNREKIDGLYVYRGSNKDYDYIEDSEGYRIPLHDYIMQKEIGREIRIKEVVHHINLDIRNNDISNLYLCKTRSEHYKIHGNLGKFIIKPLLERNIIYFDIKEEIYRMKKLLIKKLNRKNKNNFLNK